MTANLSGSTQDEALRVFVDPQCWGTGNCGKPGEMLWTTSGLCPCRTCARHMLLQQQARQWSAMGFCHMWPCTAAHPVCAADMAAAGVELRDVRPAAKGLVQVAPRVDVGLQSRTSHSSAAHLRPEAVR